MTIVQQIATIFVAGAVTWFTRFSPFVVFRHGAPPFVRFLGRALPGAIFGLLVVYCVKDVDLTAAPHGLPEAIGIAAVALSYLWRENMLISIGVGTAAYMLLVNLVF